MWVVHEAVDPKLAEVFSWRNRVVHGHQVGPNVKAVLDAAEGGGKRPSAVGDGYAKRRKPLKHPTKNERTQCAAGLGGHSDEPRKPVALHVVAAHHVPGVHKKGEAAASHFFKNGKKRGVVEVALVDVRTDLHSAQPEALKAVEFAQGEVGVLHGQGSEALKTSWVAGHDFGEVIVQEFRHCGAVAPKRPVAEHDRDGRKHLHAHPVAVAVVDSRRRIPVVGLDFAKEHVVLHHARATRAVVL